MLYNEKRFSQWLPAGFDGQFHWDFLNASFKGTQIKPMDFDAVIERRGNFLVFETKEKGKSIPVGQEITLTRAWRNGFTIIHVEGKKASEITGFAIYSGIDEHKEGKVGSREMQPRTVEDLIYVVRRWFCWADGVAMPTREEWERELWVEDYEAEEKLMHT